jgi:ABC-type Mn2+/Zn2+ transport system permease subunit
MGLYASYHLDTAAGASIALAAVGIFALSLVPRPRRRMARGKPSASPVEAFGGAS